MQAWRKKKLSGNQLIPGENAANVLQNDDGTPTRLMSNDLADWGYAKVFHAHYTLSMGKSNNSYL